MTKADLLALLSFRNKAVPSGDTIQQLNETLGNVLESEYSLLQALNTEDADFTQQLRLEGWFQKTFKAVEYYVQAYFSLNPCATRVVYNPHPPSVKSDTFLITRMLKFYALKGLTIPLVKVMLTDEQLLAVQNPAEDSIFPPAQEGSSPANSGSVPEQGTAPFDHVLAVSSGPGTGKTTAATHRAKALGDQGVICLAYTNAAKNHFIRQVKNIVSNIDDVGDKLKRMNEDDEAVAPPKICVFTIHSLAAYFLPKHSAPADSGFSKAPSASTERSSQPAGTSMVGDDFDRSLVQAMGELDKYRSFFYNKDGTNVFNHIIVDEAQDLTKERYDFVLALFKTLCQGEASCRKTLAFFGDPRQRLITRAGNEFQALFETSVEPSCGMPVQKLFFSKSFRFQNEKLLELANSLSLQRPSIHVPLVPATPCLTNQLVKVFSAAEDVADTIIDLIENGSQPHDICIIHMSTKKGCKASKDVADIKQIIVSRSIAGKTISCLEAWKEGSVLTTSIHAVKGLEFDYVFFVGANNFPQGFEKVCEGNELRSLNFVANTRARKQLYYLSNEAFNLPEGVPCELTENGRTARRYSVQYKPKVAIRSEEVSDADYQRFEEANTFFPQASPEALSSTSLGAYTPDQFSALVTPEASSPSSPTVSGQATPFPTTNPSPGKNGFQLFTRPVKALDKTPVPFYYETISAVLSVVRGETLVQRDNVVMKSYAPADVFKNNQNLTAYDLTTSASLLEAKNVVHINREHEALYRELQEPYPVEALEKHKRYHKLVKGSDSFLGSMRDINNNVMFLASLLETDATQAKAYHGVVCARIKASCIIAPKAILVFSGSLHLCSLVKSVVQATKGVKVFSVSLTSGAVLEVSEAPYNAFRYEYYVSVLYSLTAHKQVMSAKQASEPFVHPCFFVDTEFLTKTEGKKDTIWDIAVIDGCDLYSSLVTLVDCGESTFNQTKRINDHGISYAQVVGSPVIDQVLDKFCGMIERLSRAKLFYYNAPHDISWLAGDKLDSKADYGIDLIDLFRGEHLRSKGSQAENYARVCAFQADKYAHIKLHTAVSDALLLYEMTRCILRPSSAGQLA